MPGVTSASGSGSGNSLSFLSSVMRSTGHTNPRKIISKKQQSATDTTRELEIMRRLQSAEANVVQLVGGSWDVDSGNGAGGRRWAWRRE